MPVSDTPTNRSRTYRSQVDAWLVPVLLVPPLVSLGLTARALVVGNSVDLTWSLLALGVVVLIYGGLVFPLRYLVGEDVWSEIMTELYTPIQYLIHLYKTTETHFNTETENVFLMKTFQEYIDSAVTLQKVGPYDYQRFIASMKDPEFKNNMVTKYDEYIFENKVKNYLIYVTNLYLSIKFNEANVTCFTDREKNEIENCINIMPFLEFLCKREQMANNDADKDGGGLVATGLHKKDMMGDERIQWIENETIHYINDNIFM